jgi:RNA recognition motif-containing protein
MQPDRFADPWHEYLVDAGACDDFDHVNLSNEHWGHLLPANLFDDDLPTCLSLGLDEYESRTLQLANLDPATTANELTSAFGGAHSVETVDVSQSHLGVAFIHFYDLRDAVAARHRTAILRGRPVPSIFSPPDPGANLQRPRNNGTVVLFHLRTDITDQELEEEFLWFGCVKQIRSAPGRAGQKFIEFWDKRDAERALKCIKGKRICNSKVSIEYSFPGGSRRVPAACSNQRLPTIERPKDYVSRCCA